MSSIHKRFASGNPATAADAKERTPTPRMPPSILTELRARLLDQVIGAERAADELVCGLLARGHVLIEGAPGIGKTTLAKTLARQIGGSFRRVQFTPDLMPSDLLGYSLYRMDRGEFEFIPGPVFSNCLLADEINRTSPRIQSALLECMNEGQVTLDGVTRPVPDPFIVIATQNTTDALGTFPLPEAQLDRFLISIEMELPTAADQTRILLAHAGEDALAKKSAAPATSPALIEPAELRALQSAATQLTISPAIAAYIAELCQALRHAADSAAGLSVRASLALLAAARAHAFMNGSRALHPDDVQAVFPAVMRHRIGALHTDAVPRQLFNELLRTTPVP